MFRSKSGFVLCLDLGVFVVDNFQISAKICPVLNIFEANVSLKLYSLVRKLIFLPTQRSSIFHADSEYIKNVKFRVVDQKL